MALNGTSFRVDEAVLPQTFVLNRDRQPKLRTIRTVVRIIVVRINVRSRPKNPLGYTFVPVFVTDDDLVLDPSTCDVVGNISGQFCNLNPAFVTRHERGKSKVRILEVNFNLKTTDFDTMNMELLDDIESSPVEPSDPVARKRVAMGYKIPITSITGQKRYKQEVVEEGLCDTPPNSEEESG